MSAVKRKSQIRQNESASAVAAEHHMKRIADLEERIEEQQEQIRFYEAKMASKSDPLSGAVADKIIEKLADKTADGVVKHIINKLLKTLELVPAARDVAVRFKTRDMLWVDEDATRTHVLETWRKHMRETLKVRIEEVDDVYVVSLVVPEIRVATKQRKDRSTEKILIDADKEV